MYNNVYTLYVYTLTRQMICGKGNCIISRWISSIQTVCNKYLLLSKETFAKLFMYFSF